MGLFEKKICSFCGGESGLLSNQKLTDGNICKECRKGLSPYFDVNSNMSVEFVNEHLAYREKNRNALEAFESSYGIGKDKILFVDEKHGRYILATDSEFKNGEPDVFRVADFANASFFVKESEHIFREDHSKDYFYYDFYLVIKQNHSTLPEISCKINTSMVKIDRMPVLPAQAEQLYRGGSLNYIGTMSSTDKRNLDKYMDYYTIANEMVNKMNELAGRYAQMKQAKEQAAASSGTPKFCPNCGTPVKPGNKFCTECGTKF